VRNPCSRKTGDCCNRPEVFIVADSIEGHADGFLAREVQILGKKKKGPNIGRSNEPLTRSTGVGLTPSFSVYKACTCI
jgi:hypothetical protein